MEEATNTLTRKEVGKIAVLAKRLEHLERRINSSSADLSFDKAEAAALRWAIGRLTPNAADQPTRKDG